MLVKSIMKNLEEEGVPEFDQCSDLLAEYLIAAEIIDEHGNLIDGEEGNAKSEDVTVSHDNLPKCYGFEDGDRDPACKKCKVQVMCRQARIEARPACFGKLFEEHDENCLACIEAPNCKIVKMSSVSNDKISKKGK
jgi:hypothetical protein